MYIMCKYYGILYKGLESSWILVSVEGPGNNLPWLWRNDCTYKIQETLNISVSHHYQVRIVAVEMERHQ